MAHAQKPDFFFRWNGRVHLNRRGRQFSRLLAAEVCASAVVMLDTPCSEVVWRVLTTHSIRQFALHFPSRASPCAITFQLDSKTLAGASWIGGGATKYAEYWNLLWAFLVWICTYDKEQYPKRSWINSVSINPLQHTAGCETGWAIDAFAVTSSFVSVDGITYLIPFESWRNDLSNGISYI